ncbi:MAG TPA: winged helix-turn-helix transcriptional regulator [Nanoarchaeota archaeon]|nr:winged helix-turn-helix transcriptional regulator [Nanoarchaeota archaeon]
MVNKWELKGYILASRYRVAIMQALSKEPKTPKELEKELNIKFSHISRALKELSDKGVVECLTPALHKQKYYGLTKQGKKIIFD